MPQRILVLGASGYIGQHLTAALSQQGHRVLAVPREPLTWAYTRLRVWASRARAARVSLHWLGGVVCAAAGDGE